MEDTWQPDVSAYLLAGDGFKVVKPPPHWGTDGLGGLWQEILDELADKGFMRRSQTGRYWWTP